MHELLLHGQQLGLLLLGQDLLLLEHLLQLINVEQLLVQLLLVHVRRLQDVNLSDYLLLQHLLIQHEVVRGQFRLYRVVNLAQVFSKLQQLVLRHRRVVDIESCS